MKLLPVLMATTLLIVVGSVNADPPVNPAQAPGVNKPIINPVTGVITPVKRPPGWDRGRKTGWHGSPVPPGQAKKVLTPKPIYKHKYKYKKIHSNKGKNPAGHNGN